MPRHRGWLARSNARPLARSLTRSFAVLPLPRLRVYVRGEANPEGSTGRPRYIHLYIRTCTRTYSPMCIRICASMYGAFSVGTCISTYVLVYVHTRDLSGSDCGDNVHHESGRGATRRCRVVVCWPLHGGSLSRYIPVSPLCELWFAHARTARGVRGNENVQKVYREKGKKGRMRTKRREEKRRV